MIKKITPLITLLYILSCPSCNEIKEENINQNTLQRKSPNERQVDRFADIQILRYEIKDFDSLSLILIDFHRF